MRKIATLIITLLLMQAFLVTAKAIVHPLARTVTMNSGLPSNAVRGVVQDKYGYIWFATDNGLCRYDGYHVKKFYNPDIPIDQFVSTIATCDEELLVGTSHGAFLLDFETERFHKLSEKINTCVTHFSTDANGNVWVGTAAQGVFCYNISSRKLRHYPMKQQKGMVAATLVDANNQIWILSSTGKDGLSKLNKSTDTFETFHARGREACLAGMGLLATADGCIYVGTWSDGLFRINTDGTVDQVISNALTHAVGHIHQLYNANNQHILVASDDGLVDYDIQRQSWRTISETDAPSRNTNERFVYSIAGDREGGLWVSTFYGGVNYIPSAAFENRFRSFTAKVGALRGNVVGRFAEDSQHRIWIATDDGGLDCYDPSTDRFVAYPGKEPMGKYNVHALLAEGDNLWVGTYSSGAYRLNMATGGTQAFLVDGAKAGSSVYTLYRDRSHRLWAASMTSVNLFDEGRQTFRCVKRLGYLAISILEDSLGNLWFATQGGGLWRYGRNGSWKQFRHSDTDSLSLASDLVNCVALDEKGQLYAATRDGLCLYQPSTGHFKRVAVDSPSQEMVAIVVSQGVMWLATSKGVVRYEPGEPARVFNRHDGLTCDQFLNSSCLLASDGRIYLGTSQGFNSFFPFQVKVNHVEPQVAITSVELFGKEIEVGSEKLSKSFRTVDQLHLSHGENTINISFAALSYVSPEKNQYAYKLEGIDRGWTYTHDPRATYTNLPAGSYTFLVKATNNDGVWSQTAAQLAVEVHPPFWWSWPAKLLYLLLVGYLIYLYTQARLRREKRRHHREMDRLEEKQDREMREARLQFFTMIAHEIRTPVSLIIGPLEGLKDQWQKMLGRMEGEGGEALADGDEVRAMTQQLDVMDRNAQRLLLLVNQLLDFNKVQQKGMQVHFKLCNISRLMHAVAERFEPTLQQKGACLEVKYPSDDFAAIIDSEAITKVISNLMTNASKYTCDYVGLFFRQNDSDHFIIEVKDNGMGVKEEEKKKIFGAFYQARDNKPGTGIGLSIVKSLVDAHRGMVEVESEEGKGAVFVVTLPVGQPDALVEKDEKPLTTSPTPEPTEDADGVEAAQVEGEAEGKAKKEKSLPTLLIVDDDEDMRQFVKAYFENTCHVLVAEDGSRALRLLKKNEVNMVVSDWMMPEMDGPELCRQMRRIPEISHLPFIMLTAKTDDASKTEGMKCGADLFIEKPFSMKYLEASVRNLIEMRRKLLNKYASSPMETVSELAPSQIDNTFLVRLTKIIEANVANPDLSVVFLANEMGMSRSSLFNKIRGLTDSTPNEMIQLVKLKKAAHILKNGNRRVSEVSYMCGFSSPSYFSKCFQKQFGIKPLDFAEGAE